MKKLLLLAVILFNCSGDKNTSAPTDQLNAFIEEFSPSNGRGRRAPDDDMSSTSFETSLAETKQQLTRLRAIDSAKLEGDDLIDWKFSHSILAGRELEQEKIQ